MFEYLRSLSGLSHKARIDYELNAARIDLLHSLSELERATACVDMLKHRVQRLEGMSAIHSYSSVIESVGGSLIP